MVSLKASLNGEPRPRYCTMEFLNLALTGFAKSNVFDGDKDLSSGSDIMILGGVAQQAPPCLDL